MKITVNAIIDETSIPELSYECYLSSEMFEDDIIGTISFSVEKNQYCSHEDAIINELEFQLSIDENLESVELDDVEWDIHYERIIKIIVNVKIEESRENYYYKCLWSSTSINDAINREVEFKVHKDDFLSHEDEVIKKLLEKFFNNDYFASVNLDEITWDININPKIVDVYECECPGCDEIIRGDDEPHQVSVYEFCKAFKEEGIYLDDYEEEGKSSTDIVLICERCYEEDFEED